MNTPAQSSKKPLYLAILWHQHQPLYIDAEKECLLAPWVRTHSTKDYYDMAAILKDYPSVHCTFNLTTSLLLQLQEYYLKGLSAIIDERTYSFRANNFPKSTHTDIWIDLMLKPTSSYTEEEKDFLFRNTWSALTISEVQIAFFPEYEALQSKMKKSLLGKAENFSNEELLALKFWFFLANFDAEFLENAIILHDGCVCDLSDIVGKSFDGKYYLRKKITEEDCQRLIIETFKIMNNIIPIHHAMQLDLNNGTGQIELTTTPYTHPILPLLYNSDIAKICQPNDLLPEQFCFPEDVDTHIQLAIKKFKTIFGNEPKGMWPSEGAVSHEILPGFIKNKINWIATDEKILAHSHPEHQLANQPYRVNFGEENIAMFFRNTRLSDKIGFDYQSWNPEDAANDFIHHLLSHSSEEEQLITVILDGENAWEWYRTNLDGKEFLRALYKKLELMQREGKIISLTPSEYIEGNPARGISPHPVAGMKKIEWLYPGSWINASFDTWIGEEEENTAWEYLRIARNDLKKSGLSPNTENIFAQKAFESLYAAEGSDWFWWYGTDQTAPGGDEPFDKAFLLYLHNIYFYANKAGANLDVPDFQPILKTNSSRIKSQGTMARSKEE